MKEIQLTQGKVAFVDDEDFEELNKYKWYAHKRHNIFYAARMTREQGKRVAISMHRQILNPNENEYIDHKDGSGLNNQRNNIRLCTREQNGMNQKTQSISSSGFKGVTFDKQKVSNGWRVRITKNKKSMFLGYYSTPKEAALAYNKAAVELFGEFARPNVI